tara:strand:+ start:56 stop:766 length:711 start_codon:yes stop_codon:yes gene_type:complete
MEKIKLEDIANYEINLLYNDDIFKKMTKELINIDLKDWKRTMWYKYYKEFHPKTLDDIYQIDSNILKKLTPETIFEPWTHDKPIPLEKFKRLGMYGIKDDNYIYNQIEKTKNLIDSIKKSGYNEKISNKNNIIIEVLIYKGKKRILVNSGNHRLNVLKALDYDKQIEVIRKCNKYIKPKNLINNKIYDKNKEYKYIINYDDARNWPGVKSGYMPLKEAQEMFLAYFNSNKKINFNF